MKCKSTKYLVDAFKIRLLSLKFFNAHLCTVAENCISGTVSSLLVRVRCLLTRFQGWKGRWSG